MLDRPPDLLSRLDGATISGIEAGDGALRDEWQHQGVRFVASSARMQERFEQAIAELFACIRPLADLGPVLNEGGVYNGCWLESTGTINAELLSRFLPTVAARTFAGFAARQRDDGLFPYKLTDDGAAFAQIQTVSPLARSVWTHYCLNGRDKSWLRTLYAAMARNDAWLAQHRDTRGTGGVEAFSTYDTGHDLSARFWHAPDSPHGNDPAAVDRDHPLLPYIAPDLTANVACQRSYLARMAEELGEDGTSWRALARQSVEALFAHCFDERDGFFYDLDRHGRHVRVQSDVLLRVLACEVGDADFFASTLERYLLHTGKFFARYPFTSIALDDPRFDPAFGHNSWCGPSNFLSLIRAPHAFEQHGRHVELTWAMQPTLSALFRAERFPQTLNPFTGEAGFTEMYSPAILCLLDFIERLCGIMPRPDGTMWFTCLTPRQAEHRDAWHETGYGRTVDGRTFALVNERESATAWRDGAFLFSAPAGVRVVTTRDGTPVSLIGMRFGGVEGELRTADAVYPFQAAPNEQLALVNGELASRLRPGVTPPTT